MGPSERASRILQGGLSLPPVFEDLVSHLLANGRSAPGKVLVKVIKGSLEDLHGNRVITYWGTWQNLATDLLEEMEDRELVTRDGDIWTLTGKVHEGARIRPMTGVRIVVYSPEARARRDNLAYARARAASYRLFLEEKDLFDGKIRDSFQRHWDSLAWEDDQEKEEEEEEKAPGRRKKGSVARFMREYLESQYPQWVTAREAAAAYNDLHPDQRPLRTSSAWNRLRQMAWEGKAELGSEKEKLPGVPGPGRSLFKWKKEEGE